MSYASLLAELDSIADVVDREGVADRLIVVRDQTPLAADWLAGRPIKDLGIRRAPEHTAPVMPDERNAEGLQPFLSATVWNDDDRMDVFGFPLWETPAFRRRLTAEIATPFTSFGPLGRHRVILLHEMGHCIVRETGFMDAAVGHRAMLMDEMVADGFAIAWNVAKGGDPKATVDEMTLVRASQRIVRFDAEHLTFDIMQPAAELGLAARGSPNPVRLGRALARHASALAPSEGQLAEIDHCPPDARRTHPLAARFDDLIRRNAARQRPWTHEDERLWWGRILAGHPESAPVLRRMDVAIRLATAVRNAERRPPGQTPPSDPTLLIGRLAAVAVEGGPAKLQALEATRPREANRAAYSEALRKAAALFDGEHDTLIAGLLGRLADHGDRCLEVGPSPRLPVEIPPGPLRDVVVVEGRRPFTQDDLDWLGDALRGARPQSVVVVWNDPRHADELAAYLAGQSDFIAGPFRGVAKAAFEARRPDLLAAARQGRATLIGDLPELRTAGREDRQAS